MSRDENETSVAVTYIFSSDCKIRSRSEFVISVHHESHSSHSTPIRSRWDWGSAWFWKCKNENWLSHSKFDSLWAFTQCFPRKPHVANLAARWELSSKLALSKPFMSSDFPLHHRAVRNFKCAMKTVRYKRLNEGRRGERENGLLIILRTRLGWQLKLIGGAVIETRDDHDVSDYRSDQLEA